MAQVIHTDATLRLIVEDLSDLAARIDKIRKTMRTEQIETIGIDGEKGQVNGRTAVSAFVANGELAIRKLQDERKLRGAEDGPRRASGRESEAQTARRANAPGKR